MKKSTQKARNNEGGFTLLEYAVGAAIVGGAASAAFLLFGQGIQDVFAGLVAWLGTLIPTTP